MDVFLILVPTKPKALSAERAGPDNQIKSGVTEASFRRR
jgi:hypothetical protein